MNEEIAIVAKCVAEMGASLELPVPKNASDEIAKLITMFRELRGGETLDGKIALKMPTDNLSTAEAISVMVSSLLQSHCFENGTLSADIVSQNTVNSNQSSTTIRSLPS